MPNLNWLNTLLRLQDHQVSFEISLELLETSDYLNTLIMKAIIGLQPGIVSGKLS